MSPTRQRMNFHLALMWLALMAGLFLIRLWDGNKDAQTLSEVNTHLEQVLNDIDGMSKEQIKAEIEKLYNETSPPPDDWPEEH
jgi:hypothetical protein